MMGFIVVATNVASIFTLNMLEIKLFLSADLVIIVYIFIYIFGLPDN